MSTPNRYSRGKIYAIRRDDCSEMYIGSTTAPTLAKRLGEHVGDMKRGGRRGTSVQLLTQPGYYIILLENYPCTSKDELRAREQHWIDASEHAVNRNRAYTGVSGSTKQEYVYMYSQKYKEERHQREKQHYTQNKKTISQRRAEKITCECGVTHSRGNKVAHQKTQKHQQIMATKPTEL